MTRHTHWTTCKHVAVLAAIIVTSACSPPKVDNQLYNKLYAILEEQQRLQALPESEGGTRDLDVSEEVCPLVSRRILDAMHKDVGDNDIVGQTYIANGMGNHPNGSFQFFIKKKENLITTIFMYVVVNDDGYCSAQYRQYRF
jgi:hypothetical protein